MTQDKLQEMRKGFETAYIDGTVASNLAFKPQFILNNYKQGKKVLSSIEDELLACDGLSDGTLWEAQTALYFRGVCLPDCAVL